MKTLKIKALYNEFRNNLTPSFFNMVEVGAMSIDDFENWFNKREAKFFALMDKAGM